MNRKSIRNVSLITSLLVAFLIIGCGKNETIKNRINTDNATNPIYTRPEDVNMDDAKQLLIDGNKRYVDNETLYNDISAERRDKLSSSGQKPFAVILSCSDSRVPPEIIFDQALGDLFVIRNAGNVIDPIALGSIEYGAEHLNSPLIVVLGHEKCGAVKAATEDGKASENITAIVNKIKPSYEKVKSNSKDSEEVYNMTIDENIENSIIAIKQSPVIQKLLKEKKINIIGARYDLDTGEVNFD